MSPAERWEARAFQRVPEAPPSLRRPGCALTESHPVVVAQAVHLLAEVLQHPGGHAVDVERRGRAGPGGERRLLQGHARAVPVPLPVRTAPGPRRGHQQRMLRAGARTAARAALRPLLRSPRASSSPGLPSQPVPACRSPAGGLAAGERARGTAGAPRRAPRLLPAPADVRPRPQMQIRLSFPGAVIAPARLPNAECRKREAPSRALRGAAVRPSGVGPAEPRPRRCARGSSGSPAGPGERLRAQQRAGVVRWAVPAEERARTLRPGLAIAAARRASPVTVRYGTIAGSEN